MKSVWVVVASLSIVSVVAVAPNQPAHNIAEAAAVSGENYNCRCCSGIALGGEDYHRFMYPELDSTCYQGGVSEDEQPMQSFSLSELRDLLRLNPDDASPESATQAFAITDIGVESGYALIGTPVSTPRPSSWRGDVGGGEKCDTDAKECQEAFLQNPGDHFGFHNQAKNGPCDTHDECASPPDTATVALWNAVEEHDYTTIAELVLDSPEYFIINDERGMLQLLDCDRTGIRSQVRIDAGSLRTKVAEATVSKAPWLAANRAK
jgi:hypothetical protein